MKERLINNLKNDRKAELITERMNAVGTDDIYAIAREFNIEVDTIKNITFNARNFPGYGTEHDVLGRIFAFNEGENTGIIKGNAGVFVIEVDKIFEAPELGVYDSYATQKLAEFRQRVTNNFPYNAMEKNADITDNRRYFY